MATMPRQLSDTLDALKLTVDGKTVKAGDAAILALCDLFGVPYAEGHRGKPADVAAARATVEASQNPALKPMFRSAMMQKRLADALQVIADADATSSIPSVIPSAVLTAVAKRHSK
jgi:hypothetical protein